MAEEKNEKKCFVIMPITTPASMVERYHDGVTHFRHVYDCLFEPSIRKAGYAPIPPKAEGSDLIHAGIIGNLESADLVLCDMSCLNPNVFFEWGIRTALNKPVCIVKDELTKDVPFDTTMLNYHPYSSMLHGWEIEAEREKLTSHMVTSMAKADNENALWKYFGLSSKTKGQPYEVKEGSDERLDLLVMQMDSMKAKLDVVYNRIGAGGCSPIRRGSDRLNDLVATILPSGSGRDFEIFEGNPDGVARILIRPDPTWEDSLREEITRYVETTIGLPVGLIRETPNDGRRWPRGTG